MSAPSEPEKYSIDEMMDRLKSQSAEDSADEGELVTRSDGSQAIRVRKRKRRSQQPHKETRQQARRARMVQVSTTLILLLLVIFGAGAAIIFGNSAPYRQNLLHQVALSSGATAELEQFRINPSSANAQRLILTWPAGNVLHDLTLRSIKADISLTSFFGRALTGEEITAAEGTLTLRIRQPGQPLRDTPASTDPLPIGFTRYAIQKTNIQLGDPTSPMLRLTNSEGCFYPLSANDRAQLLLNHGDLTIPGWPKLRMDRSHIEFRDAEIDIVGLRLLHETDNRGIFELTGTIAPYAADRASALAVRLESYLLAGIAGPELGRLFAGRIDTLADPKLNVLSFTPGPQPDCTLALSFRNTLSSSFELNGFPFLFGLAQTLEDDWYERPVFDNNVNGTIRCADGNIAIGNLNLENKGRMALRGAVTRTADRKLNGTLEVGIAEAMIQTAKSPRLNALFGPSLEGFRWLTLKIGGTAAAPIDNFKDLFQAAEATKTPDSSGVIPSFEELTKPK